MFEDYDEAFLEEIEKIQEVESRVGIELSFEEAISILLYEPPKQSCKQNQNDRSYRPQ